MSVERGERGVSVLRLDGWLGLNAPKKTIDFDGP